MLGIAKAVIGFKCCLSSIQKLTTKAMLSSQFYHSRPLSSRHKFQILESSNCYNDILVKITATTLHYPSSSTVSHILTRTSSPLKRPALCSSSSILSKTSQRKKLKRIEGHSLTSCGRERRCSSPMRKSCSRRWSFGSCDMMRRMRNGFRSSGTQMKHGLLDGCMKTGWTKDMKTARLTWIVGMTILSDLLRSYHFHSMFTSSRY